MADMQLLLRWLDMLARNPKGTDDVKAVTGVLPPVQKLVLQLLGQLNMVRGGLRRCLPCFPSNFFLAGLFAVQSAASCLAAWLARSFNGRSLLHSELSPLQKDLGFVQSAHHHAALCCAVLVSAAHRRCCQTRGQTCCAPWQPSCAPSEP